jgi:hypothetical protein
MADRIDTPTSPLRLTTRSVTVRPAAQAPRLADVDARANAAAKLDSFQFSRPARTTLPSAAPSALMVAASVPGSVDFTADSMAPAPSSALPMYRHPADRNAAATAVNAGRVLDLEA